VAQPSTICGYEVLGELGRGTTGVVYRARHPVVPNRVVALKVLTLSPPPDRASRLARHQWESYALAWLSQEPDPRWPPVYDIGQSAVEDGPGVEHYIAREFVEGQTLAQLMGAGKMGVRDGASVLCAVAMAVERLHHWGIAHGNLDPSNILVGPSAGTKLIGFGAAGPLDGGRLAPPPARGVPPEVDVRGLRELLSWLCATAREPIPTRLESVQRSNPVATPGMFAEAVGTCFRRA
jgi:serine/threonine-protein kinase